MVTQSEREANDMFSIESFLKKTQHPTCISEIIRKTKIPKSAVRLAIAKLEGAKKIEIIKIGVAKAISWKR